MEQHFLLVTYPAHGHINPALHLAKRLARTTGARVTFSTAVSAHRRMFPSSSFPPDMEVDDGGGLTYVPFSDGYDGGLTSGAVDAAHVMSQLKLVGSHTLSTIVDNLLARSRPVTCIIYSLVLPWAADVARCRGIPSALLWIQPATVFAIYYHYFHGYDSLVAAHRNDPSFAVSLPGLRPIQIRDLPSFLTSNADDPYSAILATLRETVETLEREETRPKMLVNTFEELEADALAALDKLDLIPVGPLVPSSLMNGDDATEAGMEGYMEWLDSKPERSVVYVSFGTVLTLKRRQVEEISRGLAVSGRPFIWAMRKNRGWEGSELEEVGERGVVVEWVSQTRVLSHPAVGCFVTHCGWNSTVESLAGGVPTVALPQWTDQMMNSRLMEASWGTGVRGEVDGEGVVEGRELQRCLELVMGEGERGAEIRRMAEVWRARAREAVREGGPSDRNLKAFANEVAKDCECHSSVRAGFNGRL